MGKFQKAKSEQAFVKLGLYGKAGSGKTFTALLIAEGLAARSGKRIAYVDTERGTEFYAITIPERKVHPAAFDFDRLITRSLMESLEAVETLDPNVYGVLVIDSITHLWDAARNAYTGKHTSTGGIPIPQWGELKKPYKRLMALFLDGNFHAIICGREGLDVDQENPEEFRVLGKKMKAEGETPHEPHILGRMVAQRDENGSYIISAFFEKDRSGILTGREFQWPTYAMIEPVAAYLSGEKQGKLGMPEDSVEADIAAQERQSEQETAERQSLFTQIRTALMNANSITALKSAWDLTKGKKGRLGEELYEQLNTIKDTRKTELTGEV